MIDELVIDVIKFAVFFVAGTFAGLAWAAELCRRGTMDPFGKRSGDLEEGDFIDEGMPEPSSLPDVDREFLEQMTGVVRQVVRCPGDADNAATLAGRTGAAMWWGGFSTAAAEKARPGERLAELVPDEAEGPMNVKVVFEHADEEELP